VESGIRFPMDVYRTRKRMERGIGNFWGKILPQLSPGTGGGPFGGSMADGHHLVAPPGRTCRGRNSDASGAARGGFMGDVMGNKTTGETIGLSAASGEGGKGALRLPAPSGRPKKTPPPPPPQGSLDDARGAMIEGNKKKTAAIPRCSRLVFVQYGLKGCEPRGGPMGGHRGWELVLLAH